MPNTHVPAAGEAMPGAEVMPIIGRFSRRPIVIMGDVTIAAAAMQIERDAASIASSLAMIHGGRCRVQIDHETGFVLVVRRSS
ncbi:hypothetical protein EN962_26150 [Mesorhizobium sp. M7A.F.Ca.CA.001.09.2.1]|nr:MULTISPECIES: hypothetical protein [Mesorhizobium]RUY66304.1 hypothetical protein EN980_20350 [Mesorhizobium sp. M7A.F.Ca.CA.001.13.1.1]RUY74600.1 hypothetical protein EN962_26150 [Mesorhizobium sp. M7A.F.Ca.CA.001.09.2.1]RUZ28858.1 hypothetical protein EN953_24430 [Mesorhizobium sp. M7A.F.Ca.CA.001.04.1.1]RUZ33231.1 hypothetical protein EN952_29390 [Mesorhizobium sp. M7A.F.Ca.CA.001.15.1.1]MDF3217494.1 hypothetical protein [Mesorhizobium ciceri]